MQDATLVFLVRGKPPTEILLGLKKRDFAQGKYNGFGGKIVENETIADAAARELKEEAGIHVAVIDLSPVAHLTFVFPAKPDWNQVVHAFIAERWHGEPSETDEMKPVWFDTKNIPYDKMWGDDIHWLPLVLQGKQLEATFTFKGDNETVESFEIRFE